MQSHNKPTGLSGLLGDLTTDGFKWLLTFLISVGLVGGAGYLLFDAPARINAVHRAQSEISFKQDENAQALDMLTTSNKGWFSASNTDTVQTMYAAMNELKQASPRGELSAQRRADFPKWADKASEQLSLERGLISGYIFSSSYYKTLQDSMLKTYDRAREYIRLEKTTIENWETDSPDKRGVNVNAVYAAHLQFLESIGAQGMTVGQDKQVKKIVQDLDQATDENTTEIQAMTIRSVLAFGGVLIGLLIVSLLIISFAISFKRPVLSEAEEKQNATQKPAV